LDVVDMEDADEFDWMPGERAGRRAARSEFGFSACWAVGEDSPKRSFRPEVRELVDEAVVVEVGRWVVVRAGVVICFTGAFGSGPSQGGKGRPFSV
jgi:hypothetical protein